MQCLSFARCLIAVVLAIGSFSLIERAFASDLIKLSAMSNAVQEIYPAIHKNRLIVAGGLNVLDGKIVGHSDVVSLDFTEGDWQTLPNLPSKRHHGFLLSHRDLLFLIGGFDQNENGAWIASSDVLLLTDNSWSLVSSLPLPIAETNITSLGAFIHVAGGRTPKGEANLNWRDHIDTNLHWRWSRDSNAWQTMAPLPTARNSACSAVINNQWYVIGGRTVDGGNSDKNEMYDPTLNRWFEQAPMPQAQGGLACVATGTDIFAFGGEFFNNGGGVYDEIWKFDSLKNQWSLEGKMPTPRHGHGLVLFNGNIIAVGGAQKVGAKGTLNTLEKLVTAK